MFAPRYTLLLLRSHELARVDLLGKRQLRVQRAWHRPSNSSGNLAALATSALQLGPRKAGRVLVLSDELWTGTLRLASDVTAMLSQAERHQALALEAEVDSGISAFSSRLSALRIDGKDTAATQADPYEQKTDDLESAWWVTQISSREFSHLEEAVRTCGARLAGVAHLAGATGLLQAAQSDALHSKEAPREELINAWIQDLSQSTSPQTLIAAQRGPLTASETMILQACLTVATAISCAAVYGYTQHRLVAVDRTVLQLESQQNAQEQTSEQLKAIESTLGQLRQESTKTIQHRQKLERELSLVERSLTMQNRRWALLLDAIAIATDDDCWVQRWDASHSETILQGVATDNAAAHRFASSLEQALHGDAWSVLPAETHATEQAVVCFKIVLSATLPTKSAAASAVADVPTRPTMDSIVADTVLKAGNSR